jgi:hypothetical protein
MGGHASGGSGRWVTRTEIALLANYRSYTVDDIRWAAAFARHVVRR